MNNDTERLNWLIANEAYIGWSKDNEKCSVWFRWDYDDESNDRGIPVEGYPLRSYDDPRDAIDAAMNV